MSQWNVENAKAHLSQLIREAQTGKPQVITRRGLAAVVVLDAKQYTLTERSGWSTFETAPRMDDFVAPRLAGYARDIEFE